MNLSGKPHETPMPEQAAEWQGRDVPPGHEAGVALGWSGILGRSADAAIALTSAARFSTGVRLDIAVRARTAWPDGKLFHSIGDEGGTDQLLIGVEFADGRVAIANGHRWPSRDLPTAAASLRIGPASGDHGLLDLTLFLHPVPPPGPLTILCIWPLRGIPETCTQFTGASEAKAGVTRL